MATMKSFTDLPQSKILAEILPIESADMFYADGERLAVWNNKDVELDEDDIPCWSLASLLEQLKSEIQLENKQILFLHINKYDDIDYEIRYTNSWTGEVLIAEADNLVNACYEMVLKLNDLNLL